jgi:hypothetical protein
MFGNSVTLSRQNWDSFKERAIEAALLPLGDTSNDEPIALPKLNIVIIGLLTIARVRQLRRPAFLTAEERMLRHSIRKNPGSRPVSLDTRAAYNAACRTTGISEPQYEPAHIC